MCMMLLQILLIFILLKYLVIMHVVVSMTIVFTKHIVFIIIFTTSNIEFYI